MATLAAEEVAIIAGTTSDATDVGGTITMTGGAGNGATSGYGGDVILAGGAGAQGTGGH